MNDENEKLSLSELLEAENSANLTLMRNQMHTLRERLHLLERRAHDMELAQYHGVTRMDTQADAITELRKELANIIKEMGEP